MDVDKEGIKYAVLDVKHLPPLSMTASKLMEAITDDEIDLKELAGIIEQDPGLAARIIGLANSAYFSQPTPVYSVEEAIIRVLGLNMVKSLALGITVAGAFDLDRCPRFDLAGYWFEALASGQLARSLVMAMPVKARPDMNALYLGGLFHNLGVLLLVHIVGEAYSAVLQEAKKPETNLRAIERDRLGVDHRVASLWLAEKWHLPPLIITMMGQLGDPNYQGDVQPEMMLLNAAVTWVRDVRQGQVNALADSPWLQSLPDIDKERLSRIEEAILCQIDDLELVARQLA
ncbi:MAG: HDOD domain-containing protein [Sedimenticola sp.]|nr:HDOD domain-containing protein [Sedimenticola sp.]MCW8974742.1 HDOD domain-containing protein [Sedimenticola sp.]